MAGKEGGFISPNAQPVSKRAKKKAAKKAAGRTDAEEEKANRVNAVAGAAEQEWLAAPQELRDICVDMHAFIHLVCVTNNQIQAFVLAGFKKVRGSQPRRSMLSSFRLNLPSIHFPPLGCVYYY